MQTASVLPVLIALTFVSVTEAHAGFKRSGFSEADFFDFQRAKGYWETMRTRDDLMKAVRACEGGPYDSWEKEFLADQTQALKDLETHSAAEEIKACYDLQLTYNVFDEMYLSWRKGRFLRPQPWNETTGTVACMTLGSLNIFTGQCNDMPDWRTTEWRMKDQRQLERYRERQARQEQ